MRKSHVGVSSLAGERFMAHFPIVGAVIRQIRYVFCRSYFRLNFSAAVDSYFAWLAQFYSPVGFFQYTIFLPRSA